MKKFFNINSNKKTVSIVLAGVIVVGVAAIVIRGGHYTTANATAFSSSLINSKTSSSYPFAAAPAVSEAAKNSSASSNSLSVDIGKKNFSSASSSHAAASATVSKASVNTPIQTMPLEVSSNVPQSTPIVSKSNMQRTVQKPSSSYANYTRLDMTYFSRGNAVYEEDTSMSDQFEYSVSGSSNIPFDRMGAPVVSLSSPAELYARGEVSLDNLRSVLINGHHYVGGSKCKYIVTGVYDNHSGITYNRSNMATSIKQIYAKGFANNPYSGTVSFSDGYLCTKISDGGSSAKTGYVRAVVFTLKKIS